MLSIKTENSWCNDHNSQQAAHGLWCSAGLKMPIHTHFWKRLGISPVK